MSVVDIHNLYLVPSCMSSSYRPKAMSISIAVRVPFPLPSHFPLSLLASEVSRQLHLKFEFSQTLTTKKFRRRTKRGRNMTESRSPPMSANASIMPKPQHPPAPQKLLKHMMPLKKPPIASPPLGHRLPKTMVVQGADPSPLLLIPRRPRLVHPSVDSPARLGDLERQAFLRPGRRAQFLRQYRDVCAGAFVFSQDALEVIKLVLADRGVGGEDLLR